MTDPVAATKAQITFGKFQNVDLRVARVVSAPMATDTKVPCRVLELDLGPLGTRRSVGQYALVGEEQLVGSHVVACVNLGERQMGLHLSQALVLGARHPDSPADQAQAIPVVIDVAVAPGAAIY